MNVLSLFDGMSCGRLALECAGIEVDWYFTCEIDKYASQIAHKRYTGSIPLGDINTLETDKLPKIDLLLAGFPCQAWSVAGKQKGDNDPRGALVHKLIEIWKGLQKKNPNLKFLFENVRMKKEFLEYINTLFGVQPIFINSALLSAQNRNRYYWTNIWGVEQPKDKDILLKDIVHENVDDVHNNQVTLLSQEHSFNVNPSGSGMNGSVISVNKNKSNTLTTNKGRVLNVVFQ